jgi:pilus assembly protein CpaB
MRSRLLMVIAAIVLGLIAAYGVTVYVGNIKSRMEEEHQLVKVLVAQEDIPLGVGVKDMIRKKLASFEEIPKKYLVSGAIKSSQNIDGRVLAIPVNRGEQLTLDKFQYDTQAGLSFTIPKDYVAISISVDEVKGVSGMIKAGDSVTVIATFSDYGNEQQKTDTTKILLQKVKVVAVGNTIAPAKGRAEEKKSLVSGTGSDQSAKQTVTLSLTPADAEKMVFAEEQGKVWLTLLPASEVAPVSTSGQTIETIFK